MGNSKVDKVTPTVTMCLRALSKRFFSCVRLVAVTPWEAVSVPKCPLGEEPSTYIQTKPPLTQVQAIPSNFIICEKYQSQKPFTFFLRSSLKDAFEYNKCKTFVANGDCSDCIALEIKQFQDASTSFKQQLSWLIHLMQFQEEKKMNKPLTVS